MRTDDVTPGPSRVRASMTLFFLFTGLLLAFTSHADEVTLPFQGLTLNGNLELAPGKKIDDGVILITHGGLMHRGMELYVGLQNLLAKAGYNTLAINLSLSVDNRHGMLECTMPQRHRFEDAPIEIGAWVQWLKDRGVKRIALLGHSRGGGETASFAAQHADPQIHVVILLAPDTSETNDAAAYQNRHHKALAPVLKKARDMVASNQGRTDLLHTDFLYCSDTTVAAETIVSYYGDNSRIETAFHVPKIRVPVLIIIAGEDEAVINTAKFVPLANGNRVQVKTVEGAGHLFRDLNSDDAVDLMTAFLKDNNF